jgi:hypothetical protein
LADSVNRPLDLREVLVSHAQLFDWIDFASGETYG